MKTLMIALALVSFNAFAGSVVVTEINANEVHTQYGISADYGINTKLGRAWAEITLSSGDVDSSDTYLRAQVPGLSIVGGSVVLDVDGQQVECAKIKNVGIFRTEVARATKNCKFVVTKKSTQVDDGFEVRTVKSYVLTLETK